MDSGRWRVDNRQQTVENEQHTTAELMFTAEDASDSHSLDEALLVEGVGQVSLVAQHEDRDAGQLRLVQQVVQLVPGGLQLLLVGGVHHVPARGERTSQAEHTAYKS